MHSKIDLIGGKKVGWSTSGKLITGNALRQVTLQADFPRAETYSLEFNKFSNNLNSDFPIRAEALITWSVEGNSVSRRISIANGTTIQGVAQAVKVVINDVTVAASPGPIEYDVSVQVTPGSRGTNRFPPFLSPTNGFNSIVLATPSVRVPIPQDAGAILFLLEALGIGPGGPFDFRALLPNTLFVIQEQNLVQIAFAEYPGPSQTIPIVPGADSILISGNFAADPLLTRIQTTLLFGIDG